MNTVHKHTWTLFERALPEPGVIEEHLACACGSEWFKTVDTRTPGKRTTHSMYVFSSGAFIESTITVPEPGRQAMAIC